MHTEKKAMYVQQPAKSQKDNKIPNTPRVGSVLP